MVAFPVPLHLVMGSPIDTPRLEVTSGQGQESQTAKGEASTRYGPIEVTQSEFDRYVDHYHQLYISELHTLFDQHKNAAGYGHTHLKII